jgi:L-ascorbate metabolism protein UlaG (beta-lactamase superfamily)
MNLKLIGHMTVWIELDGIALLTDPWFGPNGWLERRLARRTVPPAVTADAIARVDSARMGAGRLHAMIVSHNHMDHLDDTALALARNLGCAVVGSRKVANRAQKAGVQRVIPLERGESTTVGAVTVHAVVAEHPRAAEAIGFVITGNQTCYFSGDTRLTPDLIADLDPYHLDVALVQSACAYYPFVGEDGMALPEAAALARAVRPRWTVPVHLHRTGKWLDRADGLRVRKGNAAQVDAALQRWTTSLQADGLSVKVLEPGETWEVEAAE